MSDKYHVTAGNIGTVYNGDDSFEAHQIYRLYLGKSMNDEGRAAGKQVVLWEDEEPKHEHHPPGTEKS